MSNQQGRGGPPGQRPPGQPHGVPRQPGQSQGRPRQPGQGPPPGGPRPPGQPQGAPRQPGQPQGAPRQPGQPQGAPRQPGQPRQPPPSSAQAGMGRAGPTGQPAPRGPPGPTGQPAPRGPPGPTGQPAPRGPPGPTGQPAPRGPPGPSRQPGPRPLGAPGSDYSQMGARPKVRPPSTPQPAAASGGRGAATSAPSQPPTEALSGLSVSLKGDVTKKDDVLRGVGRGVRARVQPRTPSELVVTKPESISSKQGSSGTKVELYSNYFRINQKPGFNIFVYRVDFEPEEDETRIRKGILWSVAKSLPTHQFDGTMLFTTKELDTDRITTKNKKDEVITIMFKRVGQVGKESMNFNQVLNIILKKCMDGLNLVQINRKHFDPKAKENMDKWKLELWPGYLTSIRLHEEHLLLNVDTMFKVIRQDTCYDVMRGLNFDKVKVERALVGNIVMTFYNYKMYKIEGILWNTRVDNKFDKRDGSQISYYEYFQNRYGCLIRDRGQPLLDCSSRDRIRRIIGQTPQDDKIHLVPELCKPTGLEATMLANFKLKADLAFVMKPSPHSRLESIRKFITRLQSTPECKKELEQWNLDHAIELEKVIGRVLNPVPLEHGGGQWTYTVDKSEWQSFRNFRFHAPPPALERWAIIFHKDSKRVWDNFFQLLSLSGSRMGFPMRKPMELPLQRMNAHECSLEVRQCIEKNQFIQMIVVLYDGKKTDIYPAVKKVCCVDFPTQSQLLTERVISKDKGLDSVANKVALQMGTKMGGVPWTLKIPLSSLMVAGYDVFHDTIGGKQSVGAFVSSLDNTHNRFHSVAIVHENNKELSNKLGLALDTGLAWYKRKVGFYPKKVVFYRDGVGEGDFHEVLENEVKQMKATIAKVSPETTFTFIIVSKRINTKFFHQVGNNCRNPSAGTVVDNVVTLPNRYDFYLVPQTTRSGTLTPSAFNIVSDNSGLKPDHLQKLSYMLCHLYYNWQGTVKVPCVVQYAHKLAALVGESLMTPSTNIPEFHQTFYYL